MMEHIFCKHCCFRDEDNCIQLEYCLKTNNRWRTLTELKERLPELMLFWDDPSGYYGCIFCGEDTETTDQPIEHKPDCLGKRLMELL